MNQTLEIIKTTPWDARALDIPTWELQEYSLAAIESALKLRGHFTIKVDPLANKDLLHEFGFYYCDTLIEPYCDLKRLRTANHPDASISRDFDQKQLLSISDCAFVNGRFHRDFNVISSAAENRYKNWLQHLIHANQVYGLYWRNALAGFIGYYEGKLVLHAVAKAYRGKGISKFWWSTICSQILSEGKEEVSSSISASNIAALNLYSSLGFSFRNPLDVYHRLVS